MFLPRCPGDHRALHGELLSLPLGVKADGGVEEGERHDQQCGDDHVPHAAGVHVGVPPDVGAGIGAADQLNDRSGERQERVGEDQREHAHAAHLQGHVGVLTTVNPAALHLLGNLQRDAPLAHVHKGYHHHHDDEHHGDDQQVHPAGCRCRQRWHW